MAYIGEQKRAYQRQWLKNRRETAIRKMGGVCTKCNSVNKLEFDHITRASKEYQTGAIWSRSWSFIWKELDKCQLLCEDCHLDKTSDENPYKDICRNGHDKRVLGRESGSNACSECRRENDRLARREGRKK